MNGVPQAFEADGQTARMGKDGMTPLSLGLPLAFVVVHGRALQLLFGEMADNTIFASQRVAPKKLTGAGFEFRHPHLELALRDELRRSTVPVDR